jgi:hypothetical protein
MSDQRCFKCRSSVSSVASREGRKKSYCVDCFQQFVHKTFRDALFRQCYIPSDTPLLILLENTFSSMALVHLLGKLKLENEQRGGQGKIRFMLKVLVITDFFRSMVEVNDVVRHVLSWRHGATPLFAEVDIYRSTVSEVLATDAAPARSWERLREACGESSTISTLSDQEELHELLQERSISAIVQNTSAGVLRDGCTPGNVTDAPPILIVGDHAITMSTKTLVEVARGRGTDLVHTCSFRGIRHGVLWMRPLRLLLPKELVMYCRHEGLSFDFKWSPRTGLVKTSLPRKIENFIVTLERSFASTPFNVLHSVSKLRAATTKGEVEDGVDAEVCTTPPSTSGSFPQTESRRKKYVMVKAVVTNLQECRDFFRQNSVAEAESCFVCSSSVDAKMEEVETSNGSAHPATDTMCYGCSRLIAELRGSASSSAVADLLTLCEHWNRRRRVGGLLPVASDTEVRAPRGHVGDGHGLRIMDSEEVASSVAEYLL